MPLGKEERREKRGGVQLDVCTGGWKVPITGLYRTRLGDRFERSTVEKEKMEDRLPPTDITRVEREAS
jgi:hypothetical protein